MDIRILPSGEQAMVIEFGNTINKEINLKVHRLTKQLADLNDDRIIEIVPTYRSLLVHFDPARLERRQLSDIVQNSLAALKDAAEEVSPRRIVSVPTCYEGEFAPDMDFVASHNQLTPAEVITIHTATPYLVYMLGFTAGFPYLGGMSEKIATPRLKTPRTRIPAGSVGIAGSQTGFYPIESPGGWQVIGRTPIKAFSPHAANPFLFAAGDYLKFRAIDRDEYDHIAAQVESGAYTAETSILETAGEAK